MNKLIRNNSFLPKNSKYYMYCPVMGRAIPHSPFPPRELAPTRTQPSFQG